jgi:hypothetical protein
MARVEVVPWSIERTYSFAILGLLSAFGWGSGGGDGAGSGAVPTNPLAAA